MTLHASPDLTLPAQHSAPGQPGQSGPAALDHIVNSSLDDQQCRDADRVDAPFQQLAVHHVL